MQIAIAIITLLCCGGFLFWFKRGEKKQISTQPLMSESELPLPQHRSSSTQRIFLKETYIRLTETSLPL